MDGAYDVAVIGAGPAGNFAAIAAARNKARTVVFEEHKEIGEPVHCGECLSQIALDRMGLSPPKDALSFEAKGIRVIFPDGKSCYAKEKGYVLEKHRFEQYLASLAQKEGAEYVMETRVQEIKREGETWRLSAKGKQESARIVIDASGPFAFASEKTGLNRKPEVVIGLQVEMQEIPNEGWIDFYIWPRLAPHGYLWMIPKSGGRANVGLVTSETAKARPCLDQFVKEMGWQEKKVNKTFGGIIPSSGPLPKTYSDGLMLVGDAAGMTSPLFEGGTGLAMKSGEFAGGVAAEAVRAGNTGAGSLSKYEKLWKAEFPDYLKLVDGKHKLYSFNDEEINAIAGALPEDLSKLDVLDKAGVGFKLLMSNGALVAKGAVSALLALGYSRAKHYGW
jgi:digeranylgeranylglycerophospholipid reductase